MSVPSKLCNFSLAMYPYKWCDWIKNNELTCISVINQGWIMGCFFFSILRCSGQLSGSNNDCIFSTPKLPNDKYLQISSRKCKVLQRCGVISRLFWLLGSWGRGICAINDLIPRPVVIHTTRGNDNHIIAVTQL